MLYEPGHILAARQGSRFTAAGHHPLHTTLAQNLGLLHRIGNQIKGPVKHGIPIPRKTNDFPTAGFVHIPIAIENAKGNPCRTGFQASLDVFKQRPAIGQ